MTKIHKKIVKARRAERKDSLVKGTLHSQHPERKHHSEKKRKAGVTATIRSHDFRFRDEGTLTGLGLDGQSQKRMARVKKLISKK